MSLDRHANMFCRDGIGEYDAHLDPKPETEHLPPTEVMQFDPVTGGLSWVAATPTVRRYTGPMVGIACGRPWMDDMSRRMAAVEAESNWINPDPFAPARSTGLGGGHRTGWLALTPESAVEMHATYHDGTESDWKVHTAAEVAERVAALWTDAQWEPGQQPSVSVRDEHGTAVCVVAVRWNSVMHALPPFGSDDPTITPLPDDSYDHYDGDVWDIDVPTGWYLAVRDGRVFVASSPNPSGGLDRRSNEAYDAALAAVTVEVEAIPAWPNRPEEVDERIAEILSGAARADNLWNVAHHSILIARNLVAEAAVAERVDPLKWWRRYALTVAQDRESRR